MTVALPKYASNPDIAPEVSLELNGKTYSMDIVEDLGAVARKTLQDDKPKILAKAIARAISKYGVYKKVKGDGKGDNNALRKVLGTTVNIFGAATEGADTRAWLTLPNRIFLSRQYLKPGDYSFKLNVNNSENKEQQPAVENFTLKRGEIKFIVLRQF